jgi:orotidine-5'-phosphate decarboxylase
MLFSEMIAKRAREKNSRIVLALDLELRQRSKLLSRSLRILRAVREHVCAVKINRQLVLPLGLYGGAERIVREAHRLRIPTIMDAKLNDVGHTNESIARHYFKAGFDAVIASPFIGWKGGLEPVFDLARKMSRGVLLLTYMSHEGASEGYGQTVVDPSTGARLCQFEVFARKAVDWNADGIIVGATQPERIADIRRLVGDGMAIYSPGVGAQGGDPSLAMRAGATYLIVGRTIFSSKNPERVAREIRQITNKPLPV